MSTRPDEPATPGAPASGVPEPTVELKKAPVSGVAPGSPVEKATTLGMAELLLMGMQSATGDGAPKGQDYTGEHWTGKLIGDYRIERELGRGGMGIVFKAVNTRVGSTVALKLLRFAPGESAERLRRFEREARAAAQLNHPNIVNVFDVGQVGGLYYLAMEYIEGRSLAERIAEGPLDPQQAVRLTLELCRALEFAHANGVIHRDIKPSNILIETTGRAQLMDFGLARSVAEDATGRRHTQEGSIMGTLHYMSPEQARGHSHLADSRSDIYSLGAVLYEMLTALPPFDGETPLEILSKVVQEEPVPPRRLRSALDRDLELIVLKAMEKDPARRYRSAAALAEDLWRYDTGETILARAPSLLYRAHTFAKRHRTWTFPAGAALLAILPIALGFILHDRQLARKFQDDRQAQQAGLQESLRRQLREFEERELGDPERERWKLIHALRLAGQPREALEELDRLALAPHAASDAKARAHLLLWKGILRVEAGDTGGQADLAAAQAAAESAGRLDWALAAEQYAGGPPAETAEFAPEDRAILDYHRGHAALLRGKKELAAAWLARAAAGPSQVLESRCAAVELQRLERQP